jgi:hypothetical protein
MRHVYGAHSDMCLYCGLDRPFWGEGGECPIAKKKEAAWALREKQHRIHMLTKGMTGTPEQKIKKATKAYELEEELQRRIKEIQ